MMRPHQQQQQPKPRAISAVKSDSYIFAIERNSIPISLSPYSASDFDQSSADGQRELLVIPAAKKRGPITAAQIEHFRADAGWQRIRWLFYASFWLCWTLSVLLATLLTASHPQCLLSVREWWKDALIYEIWTLSYYEDNSSSASSSIFATTTTTGENGHGHQQQQQHGDLDAVRSRLAHLRRLGVGALFLRPLLRVESSGLGSLGHTELASDIGTFEQLSVLINEAHSKDIRILVDFPLVVTSQAHPWFERSALASRPENAAFADFYFWRRGIPSSEHVSAYKQSTLKYFHVEGRPDLPVLSWHNGNVSAAVKTALSFWMRLGVDGFHLSSVNYLYRTPDGKQPDWDGVASILHTVRAHVEQQQTTGKKIFLFTSHEHLSERTKRLLVEQGGLDAVVNTELRKLALGNRICSRSEASLAECANEITADLLAFHQQQQQDRHLHDSSSSSSPQSPTVWPVWSLGSAFTRRLASRVESRALAELLVLMELMLPGTPMVYYGEERGQRDSGAVAVGKCKKYPQRGPLTQGDGDEDIHNTASAQFLNMTTATTLASLTAFKDTQSSLSPEELLRNFRRLARLRQRSQTMASGRAYITKPMDAHQAFALCRYLTRQTAEGGEGLLLEERSEEVYGDVLVYAANFGPSAQSVSLADLPPFHHPRGAYTRGKVVARSANAAVSEGFGLNSRVDLSTRQIRLGPVQAVVIQAFQSSSGGGGWGW